MIYKEKYSVGTRVRICDLEKLCAFKRDWKYHHPISDEQVQKARIQDTVKSVSFYHGGDVLYQLELTSGIWHEECLEATIQSSSVPD